MLREFFLDVDLKGRVWAFGGLAIILAHSLLRAWIKSLVNDWLTRFYDIGGAASEVGSGDTDELNRWSSTIMSLLWEFATLSLPGVVVHPIFKYVTNRWVLSWRLCLIKSYLKRWKPGQQCIENGAQRSVYSMYTLQTCTPTTTTFLLHEPHSNSLCVCCLQVS